MKIKSKSFEGFPSPTAIARFALFQEDKIRNLRIVKIRQVYEDTKCDLNFKQETIQGYETRLKTVQTETIFKSR